MKKLNYFLLIVALLLTISCSNTKKVDDTIWKAQVIVNDITSDYIYVAEIESGEVTYKTHIIERDSLLKKDNFKIGDILEIEYQIKENSNPQIIKLKTFKILQTQ